MAVHKCSDKWLELRSKKGGFVAEKRYRLD